MPTRAISAESPLSTAVPATQTATPHPSPTATQPPPVTPTAEPTATPAPIVLSVPPQWEMAARVALDELNANQTATAWQLGENGSVWLTDIPVGDAPDGEATIVHQEPLALSVPFTLEWEATSAEEAATILADGHPQVVVVPWRELTPDRKALRIDGLHPRDEGYPLVQTWSLMGEVSAVGTLAPVLQTHLQDNVIHLAAVGDIMLDRSLGYAIERGNLAYPFAFVADSLRSADLTVGNLESALGDTGEPAPKRYPFRAPPAAAQSVAEAGIDLVSLANNHGMDFGAEALVQALDLLAQAQVGTIGAGHNSAEARAPFLTEINGLTLAFLGYVNVPVEVSGFDVRLWEASAETPGLAWAEPDIVAQDVAAATALADLTIVVLHAGDEYVEPPNADQQAISRAAIDAGADLVIGHHAHILQGIEFYGDGVIVYGTGNFAFEIDGPPDTAVFHLQLDADGVREIEIEPAQIQFGGQPAFVPGWDGQIIRNRVYRLTTLLNLD